MLAGCAFEASDPGQNHPHYTAEMLALLGDTWTVLLAPRDNTAPLNAEGLARFDLPEVAFDVSELGSGSVVMEWHGALDDACGLRASNATGPCSPHTIRVHGTRRGTPHITSVALHFAAPKRTDRHHVPGMVLAAYDAPLKPDAKGMLLHITDAEVGVTDTVPKRDGSGLPKRTHPLEVLRSNDPASPLMRELAQRTQARTERAREMGASWSPHLRVMATRMTRFDVFAAALERSKEHGYTEHALTVTPKPSPGHPPNRAAETFALPFAYKAPSVGATPGRGVGGTDDDAHDAARWERAVARRTPRAIHDGAAKGRPTLRVHLGLDGIDVHTRGVRLEPTEGCASDGPSLCLAPQGDPTMAVRFERVRQGDAEGDSLASTASLEAALALYPWRRLYNHAVAEAHAYGAEHGRVELTLSADPDAPLALVVRAMSVLHHRLGLSDQAGAECPTRLSKAEWAADPKPCMSPDPAYVVLVSGAPVLTRGPAQAP